MLTVKELKEQLEQIQQNILCRTDGLTGLIPEEDKDALELVICQDVCDGFRVLIDKVEISAAPTVRIENTRLMPNE